MGCGASTSVKTEEYINILNEDDGIVNTALRDLRTELSQDESDHIRIQDIILPLPRAAQLDLNCNYHLVHSLIDVLRSKYQHSTVFWEMLLCEDLDTEYVKHLLTEVTDETARHVIDVLLSVKDISEFTKHYSNGAGSSLESVLKDKIPNNDTLIRLVTMDSREKSNYRRRSIIEDSPYRKALDIYTVTECKYYSTLLRQYIDSKHVRGVLYLLISRCEVDLKEICCNYKEMYGATLWDDVNSILPQPILKLHLIDHTKQISEDNGKDAKDIHSVEDKVDGVKEERDEETDTRTVSNNHQESNTSPHEKTLQSDELASKGFLKTIPESLNEVKSAKDLVEELHMVLRDKEDAVDLHVDVGKLNELIAAHSTHTGLLEQVLLLYQQTYQQDLLVRVGEVTTSDNYTVLEALFTPYPHSSATLLKAAIQRNNSSTVDLVLMVLLCSDSKQIADISQHFLALSENPENKEELSDILSSNLKGEFQRFVGALLKGKREEGVAVDEELAKADALRLHQATEFKWSGEDSVFNDVFISRNIPQLQTTFEYFAEESGSDITDLILNEFSLHLQKALLNLVYIVNNGIPKFLAKFLFESKSKSHFSVILTWVVVSRLKVDFKRVKEEFVKKHEATVSSLLKVSKTDETTKEILNKLIQMS